MFNLKLALLTLTLAGSVAYADTKVDTYGLHLFFNETDAVDVMTLSTLPTGVIEGHMHVPGDFDGKLDNLVVNDQQVSFDLFVPKNGGRPEDMIFHYAGKFFDRTRAQIAGFVTLKDTTDFVAAFVSFKRP